MKSATHRSFSAGAVKSRSSRSGERAGAAGPTIVVRFNYLHTHKDRFGVEPICRVLTEHGVKIAPSTY